MTAGLTAGLAVAAVMLAAAPAARAETVRVGGWWVSDVQDDKGRTSHCTMLTVYPAANGERVVLSVHLSGDGIGMMGLRHTGWPLRPGWVQGTSLVFDGDKETAMVVPGLSGADQIRLELKAWPTVFKRLRTAETLGLETEAGTVTVHLRDVPEAIRALAHCAKTGKPPAVEPAPFGPPPEDIDPDDLKALMPDDQAAPVEEGAPVVEEGEAEAGEKANG